MATDPQKRYDRRTGPRDRTLRVGDAEREAVVDILRREHVNGRLDPVEFQERLDRCLGAKTYADLDALVADLPGDAPPRAGRALPWAPRPRRLGLVALALLAVIVASGGHLVWLAFPFFVFFVLRPLVWRGWGHGPGRW